MSNKFHRSEEYIELGSPFSIVFDEMKSGENDFEASKKKKKKKAGRGRGSNTSTFYKKTQKSSRPETEASSQASQEAGRASTNVFGT